MSRRLSPYVNWAKAKHKNWSMHEKPRTVTKDHGYHAVRGWETTLDVGYSRGMGITFLKRLTTIRRSTPGYNASWKISDAFSSPGQDRTDQTFPGSSPVASGIPRVEHIE